jgi:hypothetical protein
VSGVIIVPIAIAGGIFNGVAVFLLVFKVVDHDGWI